MKSFLKSSRKAGSKKYLGVTGSYLFEIIDQEPVTIELVRDTRFSFTPSDASRYSGLKKRMILTTFDHNALLVFNTVKDSPLEDQVTLSIFVNKSQYPSKTLLIEAERLATFRWPIAILRFESSSKSEKRLFARAGWNTLRTPYEDRVFEKFIGPAKEETNTP